MNTPMPWHIGYLTAHLVVEVAELAPGRALDAGCGHGAESLWLAAHAWQVTAVDFCAAALDHGRGMAEAAGAEIAGVSSGGTLLLVGRLQVARWTRIRGMPRLRAGIGVVLALVLLSDVASLAQRFGVFEGAGAGVRVPPPDFHDGRFTVCKWIFRSDRSEFGGIGWSTDYPFGEINLLTRIAEFTNTPVSRDGNNFNYWAVQLTDDRVFECPMLIGSDVGTASLSKTEVQRLREYLLKGGFLWVDDFWGSRAWTQWASQIARVLPEFPIVDVPPSDPLRRALFNITEIKQVPSIFSWGGPGSDPRERGSDSPQANLRAIADSHGRIMVAMTHNTDIGDSMEREGDDPAYFAAFSPEGYALATNIVVYALTH